MRKGLPTDKVTVNTVLPWMTESPMLPDWIRLKWGSLPANTPEGVGRALLLSAVRPDVNGKALYVAGNNIVEIEDALHATRPQWLGEQLSADLDKGQVAMGITAK